VPCERNRSAVCVIRGTAAGSSLAARDTAADHSAVHPDTASRLNNLGYVLQGQGDYAVARPYFERALAVRQSVFGTNHPDTTKSIRWIGTLLAQAGDRDRARYYLRSAAALYSQTLTESHPTTQQRLRQMAALDPTPQSAEQHVDELARQAEVAAAWARAEELMAQ
jgi:Tfp pilus assembly protein PilF